MSNSPDLFQSLLMEPINTKPDSLHTSPRDESKEAILNLPLIPIIKIRSEIHPRAKLNDGEIEALKEVFALK